MVDLRGVLELFAEAQWLGREYAARNSPPTELRRPRSRPPKLARPVARIGRPPRTIPFKLTPQAELYCSLARSA